MTVIDESRAGRYADRSPYCSDFRIDLGNGFTSYLAFSLDFNDADCSSSLDEKVDLATGAAARPFRRAAQIRAGGDNQGIP